MPDLLETGSNWLENQRHQHMTRTVLYQRGTDTVELAATIGRTAFEQADEFGVIHRTESRDFLVRTADLMLATVQTLPKAGDRISETAGDQTFVYEVMAPGNEPPWRYSDPYRRTLRIHTKHVATE
ncbi:MAG TPA: hypothetical protein PL151_09530 [Phycisphaerae bacterium]|nr:hypothetical protein [Phycisphaerae bacterium]HOM53617.1 hypothetical protein [Phycisphaerae bacterium]HPP28975.1 hypothetical protein [Phycisphaerae bacterium]HPZ96976.1 hypothetical protein [Phycisphaerae bacterium]HQE27989.1 hypothetical protein [Phycisphaerae bacterium]